MNEYIRTILRMERVNCLDKCCVESELLYLQMYAQLIPMNYFIIIS